MMKIKPTVGRKQKLARSLTVIVAIVAIIGASAYGFWFFESKNSCQVTYIHLATKASAATNKSSSCEE
jgi:flagellar basal body-associated protein FliL